jgi:hypothetical protein
MSAVRTPRTSTDSPRASTPLTHLSAPAIAPINKNRPSTTKYCGQFEDHSDLDQQNLPNNRPRPSHSDSGADSRGTQVG